MRLSRYIWIAAVFLLASCGASAQSFTAAATPATLQTIPVGTSKDFTVTFTGLGGFNQPITVDCSGLAAGMSCSANPPNVLPGGPSTVTVSSIAGVTPLQTTMFQITGDASGISASSNNLQLKTTDFSLSSTTAGNVLVNDSSSATRSVQAKGLNGFTGTVTLACTVEGAPTGVTCSVPASTTPSATGVAFTATVNATSAAPAGNYTVDITGSNSGLQRTYSFLAQVKDFALVPATGAITIPQPPSGQSSTVTTTVTLTALNGFNTSTALSCAGQPAGITCAFSPASGVPTIGGLSSTLTVTVAGTVAPGVYNVAIKGTAGTLIHQQNLALTSWGPNFTQAASPATQNVTAGAATTYTVTYTALGGMTQDIAVSCGTLPTGVHCSPSPAIVTPGTTPGNQSIVTLATDAGITPANATFAITGVSAALNNLTRSTNVTLSVKDFTVAANTPIVATNVGTNITDTLLVKGLNGFTGPVALGCVIVGAPAGTNCTLSNMNPAASASGTSVTATISSDSAHTPPGSYIVQVTGTNSAQSKMGSFTVNIKDFTLATGAAAITLPQPPPSQSSSLAVPITLTALNGFNSSTALSCTGQPTGVTCAFSPASGIPTVGGLSSTLTLTGASTAVPGVYNMTVKAAAGTLIRQQPLAVTLWGPNFTQAVTPSTQNVTAGASVPYTVTFTPLGGMTQDIAVSCGPLPAGVTCTPVPAIVTPGTTPGNQSVVTLATNINVTTPLANATVAITGVSGALNNLTRSTNVTLSVKDFTVTANTPIVATNVGTNITDTLLVKGLNGFTGPVALGCVIVGAPAGTNCTLSNMNPAASASGTSVTATITSNFEQTPPGTYSVQVTGTNSAQSKMGSFTVNIKDFALATGTSAITLPQPPPSQSSSLAVPITLTALNGFNSSTALSCTGQPTGVTCAFSPASGIPTVGGLSSTLTLTGASTAEPGVYNMTVKAAAGTLIRQQLIAVTLWGPNFTQAVAPTTQNVTAGAATTYTVTYTALGGMTQDIAVNCAGLPAGVTCTPVPAIVTPGTTPGNQSVVTLATNIGVTTPAANATVAITGKSAALNNLTRSTNVTLSVKDFNLHPTSTAISTNAGSSVTDSIALQAVNGFSGSLTLSCTVVGSPAGVGCSLPASGTTGGSQTLTVTTASSAAPGSYTVQVSGSNGGQTRTANVTVGVKSISVGVTPPVQSVLNGGGQANYTVTTTALNGFTGAVTLSCVTPLPSGITCGFGPTNTTTLSLTPTVAGTNTNLRLTVAGTTPVNQYSVMVKAASGTTLTPMTQVAINVGVPSITNISPSTGAWGQTVTITGAAFSATPSKDIVMFNGVQANVSLASPTSLTVQVPAGSSTGNVTVSTFATSNAVPFTVQNLTPTVTTVTPNVLTVGAPATMITLSGTNFVPGPDPLPGSQVQLDGANISTSFVSPTQITATVTQAQAASAHVYSLTVVNPAPGGGTSSASNFVITAVDPVTSTVVAAPSANVLANNSATSTITVTVKNSGSAGISGQTVQLSASGNGNTISPVSAVTNGSGVATLTLKSTKAELKTISATVTLNPGGNQMSLNAQPTVGFVADASTVSSSLSGFFVAPAIARADGAATSNLQATIVDAFGNPLAGQNVAFSSSGSGNTISLPAVTDANGIATGTISSTTPEVKVLTATVNPGGGQVVLATHPTVAFVPYPRFAFVTNKSDGTVSQFTVNSSTGQLRHNGYSMVGSLPVALATDPANKFLFVANSGSANISAFTIGADGWLNPASGSVFPAGATPSALAIDPTGQFLYAANSGSANVSVFKISAVTGALTPVSQPSAGTGPSALTVDRTGKYLYVANSGAGNVSGFSINATTGDLTSLGSPFAAGSGPVAIAADPSGRFAFVVNNTSATVSSYTVDSVTGALTNTGSIPAGAGADAIAIDPSGSFAYVANATGNSVSSYQIVPTDGHLISLGTIPAGTAPSTITVDPSGSFVVVGNSASNDASIFNLDSATGALSPVSTTSARVRTRVQPSAIVMTSGTAPVSYAPKYAYVGQDSGNISAYSVDPATGMLSGIPGGVGGLGDARAVASDIRGKFLLVGIFSSASLRSYNIDSLGSLTFVNSAAAASDPFAVAVDPSDRFVYVVNKISLNVSSFSMNPATGAVARLTNETAVGTGARDITTDPTGRFVYTADDNNGKITAFKINTNGTLTQTGAQQNVSGAFGVKTDSSGRFLYAVGQNAGAVSIFAINANDGSLSAAGAGPSGLSSPRSVEVSPDDKFAFVANTGVSTANSYTVNPSSGGLASVNSGPTGTNSFQVRIDPSGQFLYVPNKLSNTVSLFKVDPITGSLTKITDQGGLDGPHQIAITGVIQ